MTIKKKSERLTPVKRLAENREKDAAQRMAVSSQTYQAGLSQLEKLSHYREEYIAQFKTRGAQGISAARLIEYQAFVQKLDQAIEQQMQQVEKLRHDLGHKQQSYKATYNRKRAVDKVISQTRAHENKVQENREQNEVDDRPGNGGNGSHGGGH